MASDRSDLLGMQLEEGGALVVLRARSLQVFARGPGGGTKGGTPPAAAGVGAAAPALPEASAPAHVESTAHRGLATTASRPQQRQERPGAPPRPGPASAQPRPTSPLASRTHALAAGLVTQARSAALQKALAALEADDDW